MAAFDKQNLNLNEIKSVVSITMTFKLSRNYWCFNPNSVSRLERGKIANLT